MALAQYVTARRRKFFLTPLPGFDEIYYRFWYRDVLSDPLTHYLDVGWREGRDPSAGFSGDGYLLANPDVMAAGHNPLLHFVNCGLSEGRSGWHKDLSTPAPRPRTSSQPMPQKLLSAPRRDE